MEPIAVGTGTEGDPGMATLVDPCLFSQNNTD